jgi:hypothetical protein
MPRTNIRLTIKLLLLSGVTLAYAAALGILLVLSVRLIFAGTRPAPEDLPEGTFTLPARAAALSRARAALVLVPTHFPEGAVLDYMWQVSTDGGTTWRDWTGGRIIGGPKVDKLGNPATEFHAIGPPPVQGNLQLRLQGRVTGQPIQIRRDAEERDR